MTRTSEHGAGHGAPGIGTIAAGYLHTCGHDSGTGACWGPDDEGELNAPSLVAS